MARTLATLEPKNATVGTQMELQRAELIARVLERSEPIVVIEAAAGMGKSTLLRQIASRLNLPVRIEAAAPEPTQPGRAVLWDIPPGVHPLALPEAFVAGHSRLIVAKRPETALPGLARAVIYGRAFVLDTADLMFGADELGSELPPRKRQRVMALTGGWPLLLPYADERDFDPKRLEAVLAGEWLRHLPAREFVLLGELLDGRPATLDRVDMLAPLVEYIPGGAAAAIAIPALHEPLEHAYRNEYRSRVADNRRIGALARAQRAERRITDAVFTLQAAERYDEALAVIDAEGGFFYCYRYGPEAFSRTLSGFPEDYSRSHETLVLCKCLRSLKSGDVARTYQLVADYFGPAANQPATVFGDPRRYSLNFRLFRILMLIYEDVVISDALFEQIFALLSELPADYHLARGALYNSLLECYIRHRQFAEAEDVAVRAWEHYAAAEVPMLQFYIRLHQSVIRLMQGDSLGAKRFSEDAAAKLTACGFESPSDARLLALLRACIHYEGGHPEPLARFLSAELDDFSHGEIWPTVIDLALHYGSQALGEHFSTIAARSFLDRWRVFQSHNHQFQLMIDIRETSVLQNGNRWQEANARLRAIRSDVSRDSVLSDSNDLRLLQARDDVALALAWLRQTVFEAPARAGLEGRLMQMHANLHLTGRQKICVELWLAYVLKHRRDLTRCRSLMQRTVEQTARLGAVGLLAEERFFLAELMENRRLRDFIQTSAPARHILRRLASIGLTKAPLGERNGLSRRETKVLLMITEGDSNKFIAHALGVSEATVKYHLGNVYRKLGCRGRREAITAARTLGLVN